jgi:uncharacterized membrane protein (UPF0136 family)
MQFVCDDCDSNEFLVPAVIAVVLFLAAYLGVRRRQWALIIAAATTAIVFLILSDWSEALPMVLPVLVGALAALLHIAWATWRARSKGAA